MPEEEPPEFASFSAGVCVTVVSVVKDVAWPAELVVVMTVRMVEVTGSGVEVGVDDAALAPLVVVSSLAAEAVVLVLSVVGAAVLAGVVDSAGVLALVVGTGAAEEVVV